MQDNEIKKALECCVGAEYPCNQCPYQEIKHYDYENEMFKIMPNGLQYDQWSCDRWLLIDSLDLINRLQAENEKWQGGYMTQKEEIANLEIELKAMRGAANSYKAENESLKNAYKQCAWERDAYIEIENTAIANAKAEAYTECIAKVKEKSKKTEIVCSGALVTTGYAISNKNLDKLLQELVGGNEKS